MKKVLSVFISCLAGISVWGNFPERKSSIFPAASDRTQWERLGSFTRGRAIKKHIIGRAEQLLSQVVPQLTAQLFMRFYRDGNRIDYENIYFARRHNLQILVLAEAMEYKGRFLDKIIDYIWDITSEYTWCLPAHVPTRKIDPLPLLKHEHLDLFATSTGSDLAMTLNLLEKELAGVSPNLVKLLRRKLMTRIIEPLEIRPFPFDSFFLKKNNNWRPWCCRNTLGVVLTMLKDQPARREKIVTMYKQALDEHMRLYADDGCCEEGPSYWAVNPGTIIGFYELLQELPEDTGKYARMAEYLVHARMTPKYFAGFGDAVCTTESIPTGACYRFGERTGNPALKALAQVYADDLGNQLKQRSTSLFDLLCSIFWLPMEDTRVDSALIEIPFKYYERLQCLYLKDKGMAMAVKRGHKGSHCHMDIGQFMIFCNEKPVIIDLGGVLYTRENFLKDKRYKNWVNNSEGHNPPIFNGVGQLEVTLPDPKAAKVERDADKCVFTMDLTSAYPKEANLIKCEHIFTYNYADGSVEVEDRWELTRDNNTVRVPLYTVADVTSEAGKCIIGNMKMSVSGDETEIKVTPLDITDEKILAAWGNNVKRIDVITKSGKKGSRKLRFEK